MITTHTYTRSDKFVICVAAIFTNKQNNFVRNVTVIILMAASSVRGMRVKVRPGLVINTIDRINLNLS